MPLYSLYYRYSPRIADLIDRHKSLKIVVRIWLIPFVVLAFSMVHLGPVLTALLLLLLIAAPFVFVRIHRGPKC